MIKSKNIGPIRRVDLSLRAAYPEFDTTIYRIQKNEFLIYIPRIRKQLETISQHFEKKLKPILTPVKLTNKKPKKYIEIIPPMTDKEISFGMEGILMSNIDWMHLLVSKFPKINFYKITDSDGVVNIHISNYKVQEGKITKFIFLDVFQKKALEDFLKSHNSPMTFNIIIDDFDKMPSLTAGFDFQTSAYTYIKSLKPKPLLIQRDEALWFDNVDNIFQGNFKKDNLFFYDAEEYSCYVDFSAFSNIDIRYYLMLYEVCYLTPPLETSIKEWLKTFNVREDEFTELIIRGRIRLVLPQEYSRYDQGYINNLFKLAPTTVFSKRAVSCLQQCDIVELSDNYIFNSLGCISELRKMSGLISKIIKQNADFLYNIMVWPIAARRNSFEILQRNGVLSASLYGVNKIISNPPGKSVSESVDFLMTVYSPSIHLAHSLNATYFPFQSDNNHSDEKYADMMGKLLNYFRFATFDNLKNFQQDESHLLEGKPFISPVELIEINTYNSILEFEEILSKEIVFPNSQRLLETISMLRPEAQLEKISFYNRELNKYLRQSKNRYKTFDFSVQSLNAILGFATGTPIGPILSGLKLLSKGRILPLKNIIERLEQAEAHNTDKKNIHFLSKINRVAKLKIK